MNDKLIGNSAFFLVLFGLLATVGVFAFPNNFLFDWLDAEAEAAAWGSMIICAVGGVLGWVAFKTSTGKVAGALGSLLVAYYLIVLMSGSTPAAAPPNRGMNVPPRADSTPQGDNHPTPSSP